MALVASRPRGMASVEAYGCGKVLLLAKRSFGWAVASTRKEGKRTWQIPVRFMRTGGLRR